MKNYIESLASSILLSAGFEKAATKFDTISANNAAVSQKSSGKLWPTCYPCLIEPTR